MLFKQNLLTPLTSIERPPTLQRYITEDERAPDVPKPAVPEMPKEYASNPHKYIKKLNWGRMPYELGSERHNSSSSMNCKEACKLPCQVCQQFRSNPHKNVK